MSLPFFVLDNSHEFDWTINVPVPVDGKHKMFKFKARFMHVTPARRLQILDTYRVEAMARNERLLGNNSSDEAEDFSDDEHPTFEQDLLSEVLVGFDGINDTDGEPVKFSPQTRDALLSNDFARGALLKAYMAALNGRVPEKNSSRRPARGQAQ